ncbi:hypothetical protein DRN86_00085 [Candidatus Geothermarchaeota archaeon]|nr:MAG: hypothetical protein DRN86_00085 [Candidatus Geothermarchaeota archaeon]
MKIGNLLYRAVSFVHIDDKVVEANMDEKKKFNWKEAVIDALIVAGFNFFYTLAGISTAQIITEPVKVLVAGLVSAGLGFFSTLAIKRGVKH